MTKQPRPILEPDKWIVWMSFVAADGQRLVIAPLVVSATDRASARAAARSQAQTFDFGGPVPTLKIDRIEQGGYQDLLVGDLYED